MYYTDDGGGGYVQYSYIRMGYAAKQIIAHHVHYLPDGAWFTARKSFPLAT